MNENSIKIKMNQMIKENKDEKMLVKNIKEHFFCEIKIFFRFFEEFRVSCDSVLVNFQKKIIDIQIKTYLVARNLLNRHHE